MEVFQPAYGSGVLQTTSGTAASVTLPRNCEEVVLSNTGTVTVYVRIGLSGVTAVVEDDYPVLAGQQVTLRKVRDFNTVSVVSGSAGEIHIIGGKGA